MWIDYSTGKYTSQFKYIELMRFDKASGKFYREKGLFDVADVRGYREKTHNCGIFTSIWHYNHRDIDQATRLSSLFFDMDSDDVSRAHADTIKLVEYLQGFIPESAIRIYFSGKKGFHVEAESFALGISPSNDLPGLFRYIANELGKLLDLSCVDFAVYDARRMWRIPNSQHQSTGLFKVELGQKLWDSLEHIYKYAEMPHWDLDVPQEFNLPANQWFREWNYELEEQKVDLKQRIERFNRLGTAVIKPISDSELKFNPVKLFENCHALRELWIKAETQHDLSHEERLFLLSILSFNEEGLKYLYHILQQCDDFSPARTQAHIDDWLRRREQGTGGRPYTCSRANSAGVGCQDCQLEWKERILQIGSRFIATGEYSSPSPARFAYYRKDAQPETIEYYSNIDL